jgi:predicted RNA-binding protein YlqC (UPF0109 family)
MGERGTPGELVEFMAKALVLDASAVKVRELAGESVVELETSEEDRGRVIGRQGRVAKAMRAVLAASRVGASWRLEIID